MTMTVATATVATVMSQDTLTIQQRYLMAQPARSIFAERVFQNPALKPLSMPVSIGYASAGYLHRHGSAMALEYDPDEGETLWTLQAKAVVHTSKLGCVWGHASYDNGKHINRRYCLGSDYDIIYPYVNATVVNDDMNQEHYRFGSGWGDAIASRWRMGVTFSYDAGHASRQKDPRPRNITGDLRVNAGASYNVAGNHLVGLNLTFGRYTQSNSTMFVSEMGQDIIYHLTGLGTQYQRFAGLGSKMNYEAYETGAGLQYMRQDGKGLFASAQFVHQHLRCLLTALNRLPMASTDRNDYRLQVGWMGKKHLSEFGASLQVEGEKRNGSEGIFGDPVSSVYPKIGSQLMYVNERCEAEASLFWRYGESSRRITVQPAAAWMHYSESYDDKLRWLKADRWRLGASITGDTVFGKIFTTLSLKAEAYLPSAKEFRLPAEGSSTGSAAAISEALLKMQRLSYEAWSEALQVVGLQWRAAMAIGSRYALGFDVQWEYAHSAAKENFNQISANVNFYF